MKKGTYIKSWILMLKLIRKLFNGNLIQEIINNFDPYHINELTRAELNKTKETKNEFMGKD